MLSASVMERSWIANDAGAARFSLPQGDAQAVDSYIGADYVYAIESDAGLPWWVGFLAGRWVEDGTLLTVVLRELTYVLSQRFTGPDDVYPLGAGAILRAVLAKAGAVFSHPFQLGDFSDAGLYQAKTLRHSAVLDVAKSLANDTGYQWWPEYTVTPAGITARISWGSRRDHDRSDVVILEEGRNLEASPTLEDRSGPPLERATVVGSTSSGTAYRDRPMATATRSTNLRASLLGIERVSIDEQATDNRSASAAAEAALVKAHSRVLRLVVVDPALWPLCALGADVRVRLPRYNLGRGLDATVRITGVQPDEDAGRLMLTVEAL